MGNCFTHLAREMKAPPPRPGNWQGLSPRRPDVEQTTSRSRHVESNTQSPQPGSERKASRAQSLDSKEILKQYDSGSNGAPLRRETESGIPGLTYDQAGRPV